MIQPAVPRIAAIVAIAWLAVACSRSASPTPAAPPDPPVTAGSGSAGGSAAGDAHAGPAGTPDDPLCDVAECGPAIRMPSRRCSDGSVGGPTGRCLRKPDGRCAWEVRPCPPG